MRDDAVSFGYFSVAVRTGGQLKALCDYIGQNSSSGIARVLVDADLLLWEPETEKKCREIRRNSPDTQCVISLPAVLRSSDQQFLESVTAKAAEGEIFSGILTGNLEGMGFLADAGYRGSIYADANFYLWNSEAVALWDGILSGACLPLELTAREQHELIRKASRPRFFWEKLIYGRLPMMITANCVAKTAGECRKKASREGEEIVWIRDRMENSFPVYLNCRHCMNVIYNTVPLSLHEKTAGWREETLLRLQFTLESDAEAKELLRFFLEKGGGASEMPFRQYTTGHEKRGVQ